MASNRKKIKETREVVSREQYETLQSEYVACQRKLQSKEEAIHILHRELELSQEEKEEYGRLMNHMKDYYLEGQSSLPKSPGHDNTYDELIESQDKSDDLSVRVVQLEALIRQISQKHKDEVQSLKEKLSQAREALSSSSPLSVSTDVSEERQRLISQLELSQSQNLTLERQIQSLEDEKEELLTERDYFAGKCSTLTKVLEEKENSLPPSQSTLEKILDENRHLKMELLETQAERDSAKNKIDRYKRAVDRRKGRETQSQSINLMGTDKLAALRQSVKRVQELDSLANSLSEELKEKSLAMSHLRKTNRLLGTRIAELEHRIKVLEISGLWSTPGGVEHKSDENHYEPTITWEEVEEEVKEEAEGEESHAMDPLLHAQDDHHLVNSTT